MVVVREDKILLCKLFMPVLYTTGNLSLEYANKPFSMLQALVDAPDMVRSQMNFKRLALTDIKIEIKRIPKKKTLVAAMEAAGEFTGVRFFSQCL